jgi:membrane-bound lytic murein transglycosylase D
MSASAHDSRRSFAAESRRAGVLAIVCATAAVLAGCATSPPVESTWPMVPSKHPVPAAPAPATAPPTPESAAAAAQPAPTPTENAPQVAPQYADLFDRIRAGYALPEIDDPSIDQQVRAFASKPQYLDRTFERAERYLYYVVNELEQRKMPLELAMLPIVESAYNPYAYSRARAAGIWQFIAPTATRYQVRVNWWQDGRRDIVDSTRAALDYLQVLHDMFDGDWLLALAAYNCGENCVQRAIDRNAAAGLPTDYFSLRLPQETRWYAPKLLAMARIVANPAEYGLEFVPIVNEPYFTRVEVGSQIDLRVAAALAGVTEEELHALNPAFNRWATDPEGPHHLMVPYEIAPEFQAAVQNLAPEARMPLERYRVRPGDTVTTLARKRGAPASAINKLNGIPGSKLPIGEEILLPASASVAPLRAGLIIEGETAVPGLKRAGTRVYVVRRGDTLYSIAKRHRMAVRELARLNGMRPGAPLHSGKRLLVQSKGGTATTVKTAAASSKKTGARLAEAGTHGSKSTSKAEAARRVQYVVRRGDTLHQISRKFEVSVAQIQQWNRLSGASIRPGQKIVIYLDNEYGG